MWILGLYVCNDDKFRHHFSDYGSKIILSINIFLLWETPFKPSLHVLLQLLIDRPILQKVLPFKYTRKECDCCSLPQRRMRDLPGDSQILVLPGNFAFCF